MQQEIQEEKIQEKKDCNYYQSQNIGDCNNALVVKINDFNQQTVVYNVLMVKNNNIMIGNNAYISHKKKVDQNNIQINQILDDNENYQWNNQIKMLLFYDRKIKINNRFLINSEIYIQQCNDELFSEKFDNTNYYQLNFSDIAKQQFDINQFDVYNNQHCDFGNDYFFVFMTSQFLHQQIILVFKKINGDNDKFQQQKQLNDDYINKFRMDDCQQKDVYYRYLDVIHLENTFVQGGMVVFTMFNNSLQIQIVGGKQYTIDAIDNYMKYNSNMIMEKNNQKLDQNIYYQVNDYCQKIQQNVIKNCNDNNWILLQNFMDGILKYNMLMYGMVDLQQIKSDQQYSYYVKLCSVNYSQPFGLSVNKMMIRNQSLYDLYVDEQIDEEEVEIDDNDQTDDDCIEKIRMVNVGQMVMFDSFVNNVQIPVQYVNFINSYFSQNIKIDKQQFLFNNQYLDYCPEFIESKYDQDYEKNKRQQLIERLQNYTINNNNQYANLIEFNYCSPHINGYNQQQLKYCIQQYLIDPDILKVFCQMMPMGQTFINIEKEQQQDQYNNCNETIYNFNKKQKKQTSKYDLDRLNDTMTDKDVFDLKYVDNMKYFVMVQKVNRQNFIELSNITSSNYKSIRNHMIHFYEKFDNEDYDGMFNICQLFTYVKQGKTDLQYFMENQIVVPKVFDFIKGKFKTFPIKKSIYVVYNDSQYKVKKLMTLVDNKIEQSDIELFDLFKDIFNNMNKDVKDWVQNIQMKNVNKNSNNIKLTKQQLEIVEQEKNKIIKQRLIKQYLRLNQNEQAEQGGEQGEQDEIKKVQVGEKRSIYYLNQDNSKLMLHDEFKNWLEQKNYKYNDDFKQNLIKQKQQQFRLMNDNGVYGTNILVNLLYQK